MTTVYSSSLVIMVSVLEIKDEICFFLVYSEEFIHCVVSFAGSFFLISNHNFANGKCNGHSLFFILEFKIVSSEVLRSRKFHLFMQQRMVRWGSFLSAATSWKKFALTDFWITWTNSSSSTFFHLNLYSQEAYFHWKCLVVTQLIFCSKLSPFYHFGVLLFPILFFTSMSCFAKMLVKKDIQLWNVFDLVFAIPENRSVTPKIALAVLLDGRATCQSGG